MKKTTKAIKLISLGLLITLALMGIGIMGNLFANSKEIFSNKPVTIENLDKRKDDDDDENGLLPEKE